MTLLGEKAATTSTLRHPWRQMPTQRQRKNETNAGQISSVKRPHANPGRRGTPIMVRPLRRQRRQQQQLWQLWAIPRRTCNKSRTVNSLHRGLAWNRMVILQTSPPTQLTRRTQPRAPRENASPLNDLPSRQYPWRSRRPSTLTLPETPGWGRCSCIRPRMRLRPASDATASSASAMPGDPGARDAKRPTNLVSSSSVQPRAGESDQCCRCAWRGP